MKRSTTVSLRADISGLILLDQGGDSFLQVSSGHHSLPFNQLAKDAVFQSDQVFVRSNFGDLAFMEDGNIISVFDSRESVGDGYHRSADHELLESVLD